MAWRLAYSLETLRYEVNARWPNRSKRSDGTVGDPAHAASASDHNPNAEGVVCAFDITHDPANGPDIESLGRQLAAHPHPDCKYLIFNRQVASRIRGWELRPYGGSSPHTSHLHVSVGVGSDGRSRQPYDDRMPPWLTVVSIPQPPAPPEEDMPAGPGTILYENHEWTFIRGTDKALWGSRDGETPFPLGGKLESGPAASLGHDGALVVTIVGEGGKPWAIRMKGGAWGGWYPLPGQAA